MKEELLKIVQESLSSDDASEIVKEKFKKALESAIEDAFRWGDAKHAIEKKVKEVMVPYIESYDFSEYLPKLDRLQWQFKPHMIRKRQRTSILQMRLMHR